MEIFVDTKESVYAISDTKTLYGKCSVSLGSSTGRDGEGQTMKILFRFSGDTSWTCFPPPNDTSRGRVSVHTRVDRECIPYTKNTWLPLSESSPC
jgi:hypothetical protein